MLKRVLIILFLSPIFFLLINKVYADSFYASGADTSDCSVSMATLVSYGSLPTGIYYNSAMVNGLKASDISGLNFESIATDTYPNAQRYGKEGTAISVPPGTNVSITSILKNSNPYNVYIPSGGYMFTSLENSSAGDISNLFQNKISTSTVTGSYNYEGKMYTRSGVAVSIPSLGTIGQFSELKSNLLTFTTLQPIQATRTVTHSFDSKGDLILSISVQIENVSPYEEGNISLSDTYAGVYNEQTSINLLPHTSKTINYTANFGVGYNSNVNIPGAIITDPNSHTEVFSTGENTYAQDGNAINVIFPRSDEGAPALWSGNQTSLPILNPSANMSITLIPYAFKTDPYIDNISPNLVITKTQDGVTSEITKRIGDEIHYRIKVVNEGNAPAANITLYDDIPAYENIIDVQAPGINCTVTSSNSYGIPCQGGIDWIIPYIGIGQEIDLGFDGVVANTAYDASNINNQVYGIYNDFHNVFSNVVIADVILSSTNQVYTSQSVVLGSMVTARSGVIIGYVWNDLNKNAVIDPNEPLIENASVDIRYVDPLTKMLIEDQAKTNGSGIYEFSALPLGVPISVTFVMPVGFKYSSTFTNYQVTLEGENMAQTRDGIAYLVSGTWYENRASLGVFNETLPDTGQPISNIYYVFIIVALILIPALVVKSFIKLTKILLK